MSLAFAVIHLDRITVPMDFEITFNFTITEGIIATEFIFLQKVRT